MNDTITAISTALGVGAISIIRVSGPKSIEIVNNITKSKKMINYLSHTINYDYIMDNKKIIDEVLITIMKAPKTFTGEDTVEINAHGSIATTNYILKLLLNNGCRLADPGEFTKRAFLNGKIDLMQAEGIMDLINSNTEKAHSLAINQLDGKISNLIRTLRNELIQVISNIEVNIDYPEYDDIEVVTNEKVLLNLDNFKSKLEKILEESKEGILIRDGIKTSIIGKPNVGKSSLLNKLINEEKAIVTDIEGTTRDIVEGKISIDGVLLNIIDTAGIRETDNIVESIGVKKSLELIDNSDLVLYVLNNNDLINDKELELINKLDGKNHIIVVNKCDLEAKLVLPKNTDNIVYISALEDKGIENLKDKIREIFNLGSIETNNPTYLSNARSISLVEKALVSLNDVIKGIKSQQPIDMVEIDLKNVWNILGEIIGETYEEELIDQLFSRFCLGK
jgi:tRNA modification GTPase